MISVILNAILIVGLIALAVVALLFLFKWGLLALMMSIISFLQIPSTPFKKWWAWLIQLPILFFQIVILIATYTEGVLWQGILLAIFFQVCASGIIINIDKILTQKSR